MSVTKKVDAILNAWVDYITLEDYSNARIPSNGNTVQQHGIKLLRDNLLIEPDIFSQLQQKTTKDQKGQQETVWALSFPQILDSDINNKQSYFCPLFSLDVTSLLKGEYREQGWNIEQLQIVEAGKNLATFLGLDDEQSEQLITQNGLRNFLQTTFDFNFDTYEQWMNSLRIPHSRYQIKQLPYLFEFTGNQYSFNLRRDLKEIKSGAKNWLKSRHPSYEYLFGEPRLPKHEVTYMGAFPTHAPTNSQLTALKHAQTEPVTAVQGPPGSGKTTLILHLIAQQIVQRALNLIETEEDINNLIVVSSTNNKAVDNVIEKLDEWLKLQQLRHDFLYLKGGSQSNIASSGGASEHLQKAITFLQENRFNEDYCNKLKHQIKQIKDELVAKESNYLEKCSQRDLDKKRASQILQQRQKLQQNLDDKIAVKNNFIRRASELLDYEKVPIEAYQKIQLRFDNAQRQLPEGRMPWWIRLWCWLTRKTEKQIITKAVLDCESAIENTLNTNFPVKNPKTRSQLIQQLELVRYRLENANELATIQRRLQETCGDISNTERQINEASNELNLLEARLARLLDNFYASFHQNFHEQHKKLFELSREFLTQQALYYKDTVKSSLEKYSRAISGEWKDRNRMAENLEEHIKNLSLIFPVITCTLLSIRNMLPWVEECVDRSIVDEAGMIPLHQTFPLLVRSRKAIIVGDPLQIEPIISLSDERRDRYRQTAFLDKGLTENDYHRYSPEEEYSATTYHRAAGASGEDDNGKGICLIEHYRCQASIIQYCNAIAKYGLQVKTKPVDSLLKSHLIAYHVEGNINGNVNQEEVTAVCDLIEHLQNQGYSLDDIGVISAFRAQANALKEAVCKKFPKFDREYIGTIHTFQGSEKKVIILSTKVSRSQDNVKWINKRPNLLNVAVSRAKELFILVGNLYRLEKAGSYTRQLIEHIREKGIILEYKSKLEIPQPQPGSIIVYDCEHLTVFEEALQQAENQLMIVTPWIRGSEAKRFFNDVVSVLERGVNIIVIYGNKQTETRENDDNDVLIENDLRELFSKYSGSSFTRLGEEIYIESEGTNEQILICDNKFAVVGSWNWLSHPYRKQCNKSLINSKVQIRRETSLKFSEVSTIEGIKKARVYQLIR